MERSTSTRLALPPRQEPPSFKLYDECVRVSLRSDLDSSRLGDDTGAGRRRRNAPGSLTSAHLLGARGVGRKSLSLSGCGVVGFLSLAQPAAMDLFSIRFCSDLSDDLVPRFDAAFSARRHLGRIAEL